MKLSSLWKTLTRDQRRAWNAWAKSNPVLLDDGNVRRVSGHKAMTMVLRNRTIAGEALNPTVMPAAVTWLDGALSMSEQISGPFTAGDGFVGLHAVTVLEAGTKWFLWMTRPVDGTEAVDPHRLLRFVKFLSLGAMAEEAVTPNYKTEYRAVNGTFQGTEANGQWAADTFVWVRVHQYANGQLSPGRMVRSKITEEL